MNIFTIGFTKTSAEDFFARLRTSGALRVVDVRLNNVSQLAGFAKQNDLRFFLRELCNIEYVHLPDLAPTQEMLDEYRKNKGGWAAYQKKFLALLKKREIENRVDPRVISEGCLLCSEDTPHHCHRRLVAEYLQQHWRGVEIRHL